MSRWTVCLAFLKAFLGGLEPVHVSLSWRAHTHTHTHTPVPAPTKVGGACCWRVVGFGARALSLCRRPKWGVLACCWLFSARAHRSIASAAFFSLGGRERGGEGSQDVSSLKKRDHRDSLVQGWFNGRNI